jgi:hypothetical protein
VLSRKYGDFPPTRLADGAVVAAGGGEVRGCHLDGEAAAAGGAEAGWIEVAAAGTAAVGDELAAAGAVRPRQITFDSTPTGIRRSCSIWRS